MLKQIPHGLLRQWRKIDPEYRDAVIWMVQDSLDPLPCQIKGSGHIHAADCRAPIHDFLRTRMAWLGIPAEKAQEVWRLRHLLGGPVEPGDGALIWNGCDPDNADIAAWRRRYWLGLYQRPKHGWIYKGERDDLWANYAVGVNYDHSWEAFSYQRTDPDPEQCWVCGSSLRFICSVTHPEINEQHGCEIHYEVGRDCCDEMTDVGEQAKAGVNRLQNLAGRRQRWLAREWDITRNGNHLTRYKGFLVAVGQMVVGGWGYAIRRKRQWDEVRSESTYSTIDEAKLMAFYRVDPLANPA